MFSPAFYGGDDPMGMLPPSLRQRLGAHRLVFDEYYRCYPIAMLPGPEREAANHGGKVFLPPSALDKLTRLHITYPMLFELINGAKERTTHAGVLEFIAEEGKIYLPFWIMQTLVLEPGDLLQIKSTDLPSGSFIKLQPQSTAFLEISDPKAVLENVMRNFSCLTTGDIFSFAYNDQTYEMAVLETKPDTPKKAISVLETDLEVDFAPPVGYIEPSRERTSGTSTPRSGKSGGHLVGGGILHHQGTMAQAINYSAIAPLSSSSSASLSTSTTNAAGSSAASAAAARNTTSHFLTEGHKLSNRARKTNTTKPTSSSSTSSSSQAVTAPSSSTTPHSSSSTTTTPLRPSQPRQGPYPLRLPAGTLFFGYEIKPVRRRSTTDDDETEKEGKHAHPALFQGTGQTLRGGVKRKGGAAGAAAPTAAAADVDEGDSKKVQQAAAAGAAGGEKSSAGSKNAGTDTGAVAGRGRTLRDFSAAAGGGGGGGRK